MSSLSCLQRAAIAVASNNTIPNPADFKEHGGATCHGCNYSGPCAKDCRWASDWTACANDPPVGDSIDLGDDVPRMAFPKATLIQYVAREVRPTLEMLCAGYECFEIRALGVPGHGKPHAAAGYFNDAARAAKTIARLEVDLRPKGIYCTLNPVDSECHARAPDRIVDHLEPATADAQIIRRRWLPIDFDPKRPAGIGSTDAQLDAAVEMATKVKAWLTDQGWPEPVEGSSGNGAYLLYPIDLPNDDASTALVKATLVAIGVKAKDWQAPDSKLFVEIDLTMFNAARIIRVLGSLNRKGEFPTAERPHRRSRLIMVPPERVCVTLDQLKALAGTPATITPASNGKPAKGSHGEFASKLKAAEYLEAHGVQVKSTTTKNGWTHFRLANCPLCGRARGDGDVAVMQQDCGRLAFRCQHSGCTTKRWADLVHELGKPDADHYDPPLPAPSKGKAKTPAAPPPSLGDAEKLLAGLGIDVLGEDSARHAVIFSRRLGKTSAVSLRQLKYCDLVQVVGRHVQGLVNRPGVDSPNRYQLDHVVDAIAAVAGETQLDAVAPLGQGVWRVDDQLVLVNGKKAATIDGGKLVPLEKPRVGDRVVMLGGAPAWCNFGELQEHLDAAGDPAWRAGVVKELTELIAKWTWQHAADPEVIAGCIMATWVQTCWTWRPHVGIRGESGRGKSMFLERLATLFGPLANLSQDSTEAGIRQFMQHNAGILMLDEIDQNRHRDTILPLLRTSGSGGRNLRGTQDQRGRDFGLRHIAWCGGIHLGLNKQADGNRFITARVESYPDDLALGIDLGGLGMRALAVALVAIPQALERVRKIGGTVVKQVEARLIADYAVPASILAAAVGEDDEAAKARLLKMIAGRNLEDAVQPDKVNLLESLLMATVQCKAGPASVSALLRGGEAEALARVGLGVIEYAKRHWLFVSQKAAELLGHDQQRIEVDSILLTLAGAERGRHALNGVQLRGVRVPGTTIHTLFGLHLGSDCQPEPETVAQQGLELLDNLD